LDAGLRQIRAAIDHIEYSGMLLPSRERLRTVRVSWMYVASRQCSVQRAARDQDITRTFLLYSSVITVTGFCFGTLIETMISVSYKPVASSV
jgi:hypothetical protein